MMRFFTTRAADDNAGPRPGATDLTALEQKIDLLMAELKLRLPDEGDGLPAGVRLLLERGNKIEAIKVYRERMGVGLAEAKDAVEGRAPARSSGADLSRLERKLDLILQNLGIEENTAPDLFAAPASGWQEQVEELVRQNRKIEAIRIYREQTRVGLAEAKRAVEDIEHRLSMS